MRKQTIAEQRDEIARLNGLKGRPDIKPGKPGGMEEASKQKARPDGAGERRGRGKKKHAPGIVDDRVIEAGVPEPRFRRAAASRGSKIFPFRTWCCSRR